MKQYTQSKVILADSSYFVEGYLNRAKQTWKIGNNMIIRRVDVRDVNALFQEPQYRYVRLGNIDGYIEKDELKGFIDALGNKVAPEGVISYERTNVPTLQGQNMVRIAADASVEYMRQTFISPGWNVKEGVTNNGLAGESLVYSLYSKNSVVTAAHGGDTAAQNVEKARRIVKALVAMENFPFSETVTDAEGQMRIAQQILEAVEEGLASNASKSKIANQIDPILVENGFSSQTIRRNVHRIVNIVIDIKNQDPAMNIAQTPGGIDMNAANLNLRIKRDGNGVPLPLVQQDLAQLSNIQGLDPVILSITPASQTPLFSQLQANP